MNQPPVRGAIYQNFRQISWNPYIFDELFQERWLHSKSQWPQITWPLRSVSPIWNRLWKINQVLFGENSHEIWCIFYSGDGANKRADMCEEPECVEQANAWWRHQMYPRKGQWRGGFDVFFDLRPNEHLSKQSWGWWFETTSRSLWRHSYGTQTTISLWTGDAKCNHQRKTKTYDCILFQIAQNIWACHFLIERCRIVRRWTHRWQGNERIFVIPMISLINATHIMGCVFMYCRHGRFQARMVVAKGGGGGGWSIQYTLDISRYLFSK